MSGPTSPPHRCLTCKSASVNARNLAVFIDGASNRPGLEETDVKKLYDVIYDGKGPDCEQHKFYLEGIDAHEDHLPLSSYVGKVIHSGFETAFTWNVEKNVEEAYKWLVEHYAEGDQIYLFGFSRGAYQVRALASIIHEVGLLKHDGRDRIEQAHRRYLSIDPNNPKTKELAIEFKKDSCWQGVRIHFVGVWDTISSLGLIKRDVHTTAPGSVPKACHFRHALALDERRVKFTPECSLEVNAYRSSIRSPKLAVRDVEEVWFAGYHSDVGGPSKPHTAPVTNPVRNEHSLVHVCNVPFVWMAREAIAQGLVCELEGFGKTEDVDLGREGSIKLGRRFLEYLPMRHQASYADIATHKRRWQLFRLHSAIPDQHIHFSVFPGGIHRPQATRAYGIDIPVVRQKGSGGLWETGPRTTSELSDESMTTRLLTLSLTDQQKVLEFLGEVLHLLDFRLDNRQTQRIPVPEWLGASIHEQSGFEKIALTVIYDAISNPSASDPKYSQLVESVTDALKDMLSSSNQLYLPGIFHVVRFSTRHERLRRRFIARDDVIKALVLALERTIKSGTGNVFPSIVDSLCYLIRDERKRDYVINQLTASPEGTKTGPTRLSLALEVKAPGHLVASLAMIVCVAQYQPASCQGLKPRITELARKERGPVGSAAVEALVALNVSLPRDVHFPNVLGYLANTLPRLDVEVGSTSLPDAAVPFPSVLRHNGSNDGDLIMRKLLQAIESRNAHERTAATLTLLKLCPYSAIRDLFSEKKVIDTFLKQLERKETCLLASYALSTCLQCKMWKPADFPRASEKVKIMLDNGWFDGAIGRVEGSEIFRGLMTSGDLRQGVIDCDIVTPLRKKLESSDRHQVCINLICLDIILEKGGSVDLGPCVAESLNYLRNKDRKTQKKGVKVLSALARTKAGEKAIEPHVIDIVKMLLPPTDRSPVPRSRLFGPTAALYDLCKNETLRERIKKSKEYAEFRRLLSDNTLYPNIRGSWSRNR